MHLRSNAQMPTKNRGKSAAIVSDSINFLNGNGNADVTWPSTSPLKIESVNPSRKKNATNRLLQRSYSTLGLNYFNGNNPNHNHLISDIQRKNDISTTQTSAATKRSNRIINGKNGENVGITTKTIPSQSQTNPQNAQNIHHGFWRIQRTPKEKEHHPDRINLDRRGLATLPLIIDEPNLRLLSLQHNLINSLCVPAINGNENPIKNSTDCSSLLTTVELIKKPTETNRHLNKRTKPIAGVGALNRQQQQQADKNGHGNGHGYKGHRLARTQSIQKQSTSSSRTLSRNFSINSATIPRNRFTNNPIDPNNNGNGTNGNIGGPETVCRNTLIPKSALLHSKEKYVLNKSNSFINSYSKHLGRLIQNRNVNGHRTMVDANANGGSAVGGGTTILNQSIGMGSSFSSDSIPDIELQAPNEMLMIKNDPFSGFAQSLQNLVFLDLYDNQIERISCLDGLTNLTVLLLGKNRINDISGIVSVKRTLRVLDMHGNKISSISRICQLLELKSLNLAGNHLKQIQADDFHGLTQLKELNLKRNRIKKLNEKCFDDLVALERLWLCHNEIEKVSHMMCIAKAVNIREITIENNPVSLAGDCISFLVSHLRRLALFNQMQVTDQVRRAAMEWRRNRELFDDTQQSEPSIEFRREDIISNARTNWELLRSQQTHKLSNHLKCVANNKNNNNNNNNGRLTGDAEVESNLSENVIIDRKVIRQKTQIMRTNFRKSTTKMKRSLSQDNSSNTSNELRLPPIIAQTTSITAIDGISGDGGFINANHNETSNGSTASSVGVNVDSTSSHFDSMENDEPPKNHIEINSIQCQDNINDADADNNNHIECNTLNVNNIDLSGEPINETNQNDGVTELHSEMIIIQETNNNLEPMSKNTNPILLSTTIDNNNAIKINNNYIEKPVMASVPSVEKINNNITKPKTTNNKKICQHQSMQRLISPPAAAPTVPASNPLQTTPKLLSKLLDREREQGGDYLIEICGRYLNVYGSGAIKFLDRNWNVQKANDVHTVKFSYVNFNNIAIIFGRIKIRFPNAEHFGFRETNIQYLGQLNALAELQGIKTLTIESDGNPIHLKSWRSYAIYRLSHWGIKMINDVQITSDEIDAAELIYSGLSDLVIWSLPETLIEPLLMRLHFDESCGQESRIPPKQWLMAANPSLRSVVGKEALQWNMTNATAPNGESEIRQRGRICLTNMMMNTINAVEKLQKLNSIWPNTLLDLIKTTLIDYTQIDAYVEDLIAQSNLPTTNTDS